MENFPVSYRDKKRLSKVLTFVENRNEGYIDILKTCFNHSKMSKIVGITGPPGAGKSTLISSLIGVLIKREKKVAVLAIDPSSSFTSGAILGDRIRMVNFSLEENVFIRSVATRGSMGGLSKATSDMILVLECAGFDYILVETVGVGQDEVDIAKEADCTVLLLVPNLGDDIQTLKAGIMEIADIFVINKADLDGVEKLSYDIESSLTLINGPSSQKKRIIKTIASKNIGTEELMNEIEDFFDFMEKNSILHKRRKERLSMKVKKVIFEEFEKRLKRGPLSVENEEKIKDLLYRKEKDPYTLAEEIFNELKQEEVL